MAQRHDASTSRQITVISLLRRTNHLMVNEIRTRARVGRPVEAGGLR